AGSGPDRAYVGADDGVNDLGNAYSVTGLGFDAAEKITYLMELMLTSTATFAEARQVSIAVATELSGNPCSAMVESVTNAWYAVGVGAKFVKPCSVTFGFINRSDISVTESAATAGCTAQKSLTIPVFIPANATVNISTSGSAYVARDFTIAPYQLSNTTTAPRKATFSVNILNDGGVEATETIVLKLKISNTGGNAVDSVLTVSILDDDVVPIIGNGEKSLLNETFTRANGFTDPTGWKEILEIAETTGDPLATGKNQWGIFDNKLAITGKEGLTNTQLPNGTYNSASESRTLVRTPLIDARGLSLVTVSFAYLVQGEVDPATLDPENFPAFDYMAVAYSTDGVNFIELNTGDFRQFASALPVSGTFTGTLPASLANKQFYLAFRWNNDANAGGPQSVTIDNFTVKGATRKIESDAVHGGSEKIDPYGSAYFYSTQDGQVVGYLQNNSASNFGCTNVTVEKAGNATFNLYQDATHQHKVSDKVVRIAPAGSFTASTVVTLYFTEAQLKALEQATGTARTSFRVYKVNAAGYAGATSANTVRYTPVYTAIPGAGGSFRVSFTAAASGSYALGAAVAPAVTGAAISRDFPEAAAAWRFHSIYPNPGTGTVFLNIDAPQAQRVRVEVVNVAGQLVYQQIRQLQPGTTSIALPARKFGTGSYRVQVKNDQGETLNSQQLLRQ
ncbi:MAG TPA: T9SS type A sorting domain-containing protein, partial [Chitinophagaceae bacterium]|nr:T9SS type A sorting domain-containing protein [Chitinophagaceae bacterium]